MKYAGCAMGTLPVRLPMPPSAAMNWWPRRLIEPRSLPFAFSLTKCTRSTVLRFCDDQADGVAAATTAGDCKFTIANTDRTAGATESRIWSQFAGIVTISFIRWNDRYERNGPDHLTVQTRVYASPTLAAKASAAAMVLVITSKAGSPWQVFANSINLSSPHSSSRPFIDSEIPSVKSTITLRVREQTIPDDRAAVEARSPDRHSPSGRPHSPHQICAESPAGRDLR